MASCEADSNTGDCPRSLSDTISFFLSRGSSSNNQTTTTTNNDPSQSVQDPRPSSRRAANRHSKIAQHILLFESGGAAVSAATPDDDEPVNATLTRAAKMSHSHDPPSEHVYVNLQDLGIGQIPLPRPQEPIPVKKKPIPKPRRSVFIPSTLPETLNEVPEFRKPVKDLQFLARLNQELVNSNGKSKTLPSGSVRPVFALPLTQTSGLLSGNLDSPIFRRPLPEPPKDAEGDELYNDGEPIYQELSFVTKPPPNKPAAAKRISRRYGKNFRSLRGVPIDLDIPKPKPRASSFTTADLVSFPPTSTKVRVPLRPHSSSCSSMSLTESDSGVSLEQDSMRDDASIRELRQDIFLSSLEKMKGFQCRSESLSNSDARVKNAPKVLADRNRRHTLPVSVLPNNLSFNSLSDDMFVEVAQYPPRSLWCQQLAVMQSGTLEDMSEDERKLQEAAYEIICSEASHLRCLNTLIGVFKSAPELTSAGKSGDLSLSVLSTQEEQNLFLNISDIRTTSCALLKRLHERCLQHQEDTGRVTMPDFSEILEDFARNHTKAYVNYCSNQLFQERTLKGLKERKRFQEVIRRLESHPSCEHLSFRSYLMLPMQRITRFPLLLHALVKRLDISSIAFMKYNNALTAISKVVKECDEGAKRCASIEELCRIDGLLQFDVSLKKIPIISASRCLVKRGTIDMIQIEHKILPRRTFHKKAVHILVFNDLFVLTKPKSGNEEALTVIDHCPRNLLDCQAVSQTERDDLFAHTSISTVFPSPESFRGVKLILLRNHSQKTVEFFVVMALESEYMRWMNVLNPSEKVDGDEKIYEVWDCPQYEIMTDYEGKENDELSLVAGDAVEIYRKSSDGWMEGRRLSDGRRGWLPTTIAKELMTEHARARNLKERHRLLAASEQILKERIKGN